MAGSVIPDFLIAAVPLAPLISSAALILFPMPKTLARLLGVGSVGVAALCVLAINLLLWNQLQFSLDTVFGNWISVGNLKLAYGLYLDPLSLVMISVVTGVGFLIHLYSAGFMDEDADFQRFFAYLNLFVAAMLILVLGNNLVLLYLGWEGVGLCSYLLIGFWHQTPANTLAANKAFIMTRVGDTAMAIGLFMLFYYLGSLDIQTLQQTAVQTWPDGGSTLDLICLLLLGGAVGKSGQLPLQSWLPDAMAGPTPVSALIHAATMVTAGVYLIARCSTLFELSPVAMQWVAWVGAATLFLAASAALVQTDIKRILAYSTISQIGYMFLALGTGAWSAAIFHLMTHAFFKALLFLAAGAVIYSLHHEHNIFRMGGQARRQPLACAAFLIGCAALASLPMMSGFFSKEMILERLLEQHLYGLWFVAIAGALMTAYYSFRLFFVVFLGSAKQEPDRHLPWVMRVPLVILMILAAMGGIQPSGLNELFIEPVAEAARHAPIFTGVTLSVPLLGVLLAWGSFRRGLMRGEFGSGLLGQIQRLLFSGWGFDWLYWTFLVRPFKALTHSNRTDIVDRFVLLTAKVSEGLHMFVSVSQNGLLRWYSASLILFAVLALTYVFTTAP